MMKKNLRILLVMLLMAALLAGCASGEPAKTEATVPAGTEEAAETAAVAQDQPAEGADLAATEAAPQETQAVKVPQPTVPQNCIVVSTAYGNFQYQDQWIEFMRVEQHAEGSNLRVTFSAEINNVRYGLFELLIGEMEGTPVGQVTDAEGVQRNVYIHMMEIEVSSALTNAEQNRLYAMQEDINYIIDNMK